MYTLGLGLGLGPTRAKASVGPGLGFTVHFVGCYSMKVCNAGQEGVLY